MPRSKTPEKRLKWAEIFETLQRDIRGGAYPQGVALPSEEALIRRFGVSRITAVRAMDELRKRGLVWRKRGCGTFATSVAWRESGRLGFIFPSLSFGEIFPSICQSLTRFAQKDGYSVVLGDISSPQPSRRAREACDVARMFVAQGVAGVVFQPLAFLESPERVTRRILDLFAEADIPVVLLDRDILGTDAPHDFVGIDNLSAGRAIGAHLVERGAKRIGFLMRPKCASVIRDRLDGVMSAVGRNAWSGGVIVAEPSDARTLAHVFSGRGRPDAVVCESDYVAAQLRNTLAAFGLSVPKDIRLAGFDDVRCAVSATPPLTTVRQPCDDLALVAYKTLRERMREPSLPARRILLSAPLVVRDSTR
ncbi:MAG: GntR family transcriptional regulator [Kiritimatiellae bacterium]|nr:GntR family transcriptional regulator [Kiritimatiellia bacterium]